MFCTDGHEKFKVDRPNDPTEFWGAKRVKGMGPARAEAFTRKTAVCLLTPFGRKDRPTEPGTITSTTCRRSMGYSTCNCRTLSPGDHVARTNGGKTNCSRPRTNGDPVVFVPLDT